MSAFNHHAQLAMARARPGLAKLAAWLIDLASNRERSVPSRISRETRLICLRLLRPAEALARRLIVAMVIDLMADDTFRSSMRRAPPEGVKAPHPFILTPAPRKAASTPARAPGFRLFEFVPRSAIRLVSRSAMPVNHGTPRILDLSKPLSPQQDTADAPVKVDPLLARIDAFNMLVEETGGQLTRSAHRLARRILRSKPYKRCNPLRPGFPPGARSRHTPDWMQDALLHLAREIRHAPLLRPPPFEPASPPDA